VIATRADLEAVKKMIDARALREIEQALARRNVRLQAYRDMLAYRERQDEARTLAECEDIQRRANGEIADLERRFYGPQDP
jgi:hypothetical protein